MSSILEDLQEKSERLVDPAWAGADFRGEIDWLPLAAPQVRAMGAAAVPRLQEELKRASEGAQGKKRRPYRCGIIVLLGCTNEPGLIETLLRIATEDSDRGARIAAVRALGLLKDKSVKDNLREMMGTGRVPVKHLLWAIAMPGEKAAELEYLRLAYLELTSHHADHPWGPRGGMSDDYFNVKQEWLFERVGPPSDKTERHYREWPAKNLREMSLLRSKEAVDILIEYLRSPNGDSAAGALLFLKELVEHEYHPGDEEVDLLNGRAYVNWRDWWYANRRAARWSESKGKFIVEKGTETGEHE
jgi:HEAT repeat protein